MVRYGLSCMGTHVSLCSVTAVMYEICFIGPSYNGTQQCHIMRFSLVYQRQYITCWQNELSTGGGVRGTQLPLAVRV